MHFEEVFKFEPLYGLLEFKRSKFRLLKVDVLC